MGKSVFVDGTVLATQGNLYTRNIFAGCEGVPFDCEYIKPEGEIWEVTEDTGSIFDTYYVRGDVVATGSIEAGDIYAFKNIYEFTVRDYREDCRRLKAIMELDIPHDKQNLFYQQQFASSFSLLENFLCCTFFRETCDREDAYHRVWNARLLDRHIKKECREVANGPDCLKKELLYIDAVNQVMYHNAGRVRELFREAFHIDVDLTSLETGLAKRHDIVHRFGHDKMGGKVMVTKEDVLSLLTEIDSIVEKTAEQILALTSSE